MWPDPARVSAAKQVPTHYIYPGAVCQIQIEAYIHSRQRYCNYPLFTVLPLLCSLKVLLDLQLELCVSSVRKFTAPHMTSATPLVLYMLPVLADA
jgi:hypothetical protein